MKTGSQPGAAEPFVGVMTGVAIGANHSCPTHITMWAIGL